MSFWNVFFLLLIYIPLLLVWAAALIDIFRRDDMRGVTKAVWVAVVILIPFVGTLIYLILYRPGATAEQRSGRADAKADSNLEFVQRYAPDNTAQQLSMLADLKDRGALTEQEYAAQKAKLLETAPTPTPTPSTPSVPAQG